MDIVTYALAKIYADGIGKRIDADIESLSAVVNEIAASISEEYDPTLTYEAGKLIRHDGKLYRANVDITAPEAWTPEHWTEVDLEDEITAIKAALTDRYTKGEADTLLDGKVDAQQDAEDAGKVLKVGADGTVAPGNGGLLPVIHVFTIDGAVVTAVNGSTEITAVSHIDHADIEIPNYGTWMLYATNRGFTSAQQAVFVDTVKEYSLTIEMAEIYGVTWDKTASTVLSRTDDAALFAEPVPYMDGMQPGDYHSPFDAIQPWAGMVRSTDETVGELVAIPKYYYKWTNTAATLSLQIATKPTEGFHVSPAHADRGDGKGERDVVYIGRYHCGADYKSKTGVKPKVSITRATARSGIHALGDDIWMNDFALFWTIRMLYLVEYADWNCQKTIGYGRGNGSAVENMGYTDNMPYHTGTTLSDRSTYGVSTQYRNIEGVWDNCLDWCDGIRFSGRNVYCFQKPADCSDSSGGTLVFDARPTTSDFISAWNVPNVNGFEWALYPSEVRGGETTYVADKCYYGSSGVVLLVGGNYGQNQYCGMFYLLGDCSAGYAYGDIGSRLQKLP